MCKPNYGGIVLLSLLLASCIGGNFGVQPVVESTPTAQTPSDSKPSKPENVFIVSASAVNYRHEQKNLPKRYQSRAICASPSPAGKCP